MNVEICMPRFGQSMEEGRVLRWLKSVGDKVGPGDAIAEIETDKAAVEMESTTLGILVKLSVAEGEIVPVGTPIAVVDDGHPVGGTEMEATGAGAESSPTKGGVDTALARGNIEKGRREESKSGETGHPEGFRKQKTEIQTSRPTGKDPQIGSVRPNVSPVARQLAEQYRLELDQIRGTGPGGRIVRTDVEAYLAAQKSKNLQSPEGTEPKRVLLPKIKQTTARRMSESKASIPHFYVTAEIRMDQALALRNSLIARQQDISINDLVLRAATLALAKFPHLNARFAGDKLLLYAQIDLAVAVALDEGLITPVIHNCEALTLTQLAAAARGIAERARAGHLRPEDLDEGTFTVSNLGPFGVTTFHAIVNPPQAAILAVGAVHQVADFDANGRLIPTQLISATVSADHRVTDGAEVARFLQELKRILEGAFELL
jgi:pyruvate dehydrogenase E2 component (dihydrolipoamide acetyltransferase)